jgi:hypothetical protein
MSSTNSHGHDTPAIGGPTEETVKRGYEVDTFDTKSVLSVPLLVILFFVLAFGTVTVLFGIYSKKAPDRNTHPLAAERNKADLNTRLDRIRRGGEVDQPRLEPLRRRKGSPEAITSSQEESGNSPELHPEDLIATSDRYPELFKSDANRVGLDQSLALDQNALNALFKTQATGTKPPVMQFSPTGSNAGRGAEQSQATPPKLPVAKQPEVKQPDPVPPPKGGKQ